MPIKRSKKEKVAVSQVDDKINASTNMLFTIPERIISYKPSRKILIILIIAGLLALAFYKKQWFVAATVNGQPITTLDLFARLNQQHRTEVLNQIINEKIILDEARGANIVVSEEEINQKIADLEKSVGGANMFESLLSQQGETKNSIRQKIRLQLIIEKLYRSEATVSAKEIDQFIKTSSEMLRATESASQRKEAEEVLKQQKINDVFSKKFQELKQKSDVKIF